jgi:hypothetical protein
VWASVWTSYPPAAHATSPSWSWTEAMSGGARGISRGVVTRIGWRPGFRFRDVVQAVITEHRRSPDPKSFPAVLDLSRELGLGPCAPTLRSRLGFFPRSSGTCLTYRLVAGSTSLQTWRQTGWAGGRTGTPLCCDVGDRRWIPLVQVRRQ